MNTLLPGYNRPISEARVIDRELLQTAQQLARKHEDWALANAVLREAYGK
ncbi:glycosyltransferase [Klebsiella phage MEW1]|uniref:Putative glycosyl transferase n=1 Tax=Klebsiella phage MEW1 TaxID=2776813 RepID=A0A7M1IDZ7_9CAUD|nr:glycosyltransferase [Klebsiella phage MEW1]QOQ37717.1 putative glycosyl transferase [Klebsiella phage MEW1]